jgi:hypothetical protein
VHLLSQSAIAASVRQVLKLTIPLILFGLAQAIIQRENVLQAATPTTAKTTLWCFEPLNRPALPTVQNAGWAKTPLDQFILAAQQQVGLTPSGEANRRTLLRRLYFDLIGLPPTPAQIEAFVNDADPKAYENLVDQLLASPHYGERWGRHWLDLARYADSMGYRFDDDTAGAYQYRDFVIRAFSNDLPYNTFVQWQLAGDELAPANPDALAATGFCAVGPRERDEGDPLNRRVIRNNELDDLVTTTSATMLGLTMGCARCHDHKFDPLSQREYYQMAAAFVPGERKQLPLENSAEAARLKAWNQANGAVEDRAAVWRAHYAAQIHPVVADLSGQAAAIEAEFKLKAGLKSNPDDLSDIEFRTYKNETDEKLPDFDTLEPRTSGVLHPGRIDLSAAPPGKRIGLVMVGHLTVPSDGSFNFHLTSDDRARLTINGKIVAETDGMNGVVTVDESAALTRGPADIRVDYLQGIYGTTLKLTWDGPGIPKHSLSDIATQLALLDKLKKQGGEVLGAATFQRYQAIQAASASVSTNPCSTELIRTALPPEAIASGDAIAKDREKLRRDAPPPPTLCQAYTDKGPTAPKAYIFLRGSVESPGEEVHPGFIAGLTAPGYQPPARPANARGTYYRAQLADWMTDTDRGAGRLLARVMVNRLWYYHFGEGLVRTPSDFGSQGDTPVLPQLLDWMASELIADGWRLKPLQKMIVMSAAYRQSDGSDPAKLAIDPENHRWWHRRPLRIDSEILHDSILAVSGRLNEKMYGPGVKVPIPAELIITRTEGKDNYPKNIKEGPDVWRRGVYIFQKRTVPVPMTAAFDGPDLSCTVGRREQTTVAPQALMLMNDPFVRSCSAQFAAEIQKSAPTAQSEWIDAAFEKALGRAPTAAESQKAAAFLERQTQLRNGDRATALTDFCQAVLSLNEFMYVD